MFLKNNDVYRFFVTVGNRYMVAGVVGTLLAALLLWPFTAAHAIDISDNPMETQVQSAAANIMFVLDNSGSMDWEFMTGSTDGKFEGNIEYLFNDPGDNTYPTTDGNGTILTGSNRGKWKSQWSVYNKVYYDPSTVYLPWPQTSSYAFTNADVSTPKSNPVNPTPTFDIRSEFHSVVDYTGAIIVDNQDVGTFATTGTWNESGANNEYNGSSFYTQTVGDTATWTPNLPSTDTYDVYAWWCYYSTRDTNALYTINHNSGSANVRVNQQQNAGQWVLLGTYDFDAGTTGFVRVTRDGSSTQDSTSADAVMFVPSSAGSPVISIKRAHYYTWHDADEDGELDSTENVYLVNFIDSDSDNVLDTRQYYKLTDADSDDIAESGELTEVTDAAEQELFIPKVFDENGAFVRYRTHAEDLQNFANWYQYYRRRELAAKAVVATAINGMEGVSIGLYSINSGVRQEVLPIKLDMAASEIVDNQDAGFSTTGSGWTESGASDEYHGSSLYTYDIGDTATWTPNLPATGTYEVYAWWCYWDTRDTNALYTVNHAAGSDSMRVNQQQDAGQWILLGTYNFNAGTAGNVTVTRDASSTQNSTSADAVMFVQISGATVNVDKTYTLLDLLYEMDSDGSTPLRVAVEEVGKYYDQSVVSTLGASPFGNVASGGSCQKAYAIVMTDGYYNGSAPSVGDADGDQGEPYADDPVGSNDYSNTLADVAMYYYKTDLSTTLPNDVPSKGCDTADHQHMTTYTLSFGVTGTIDLEDLDGNGVPDTTTYAEDPCFDNATTPVPTWPNPANGNPEKIDDLFHAAVNGRGLFFSASNPEELVRSMQAIVSDIYDPASGASVSVNGEELGAETVLYQARYLSGDWIGEVLAFPINPATGAVKNGPDDILWNSADKLERVGVTWNNRRILTYNGADAGIPFRWNSLTTAQQDALKEAVWAPEPSQEAHAERILEYIRGRSDNIAALNFRYRTKVLGDIVHSAPVLVGNGIAALSDGLDNDDDGFTDSLDPDGEREGGTIFVGGNDGMLHAFNAQNGWERFAYVPNLVFANLKSLKDPNFTHRFYVDMTPYFKEIQIKGTPDKRITYLVGGLGAGGRGYYMLKIRDRSWNSGTNQWDDVMNVDNYSDGTSETNLVASQMVRWEYPRADTAGDGMDNDGDGTPDEAGETDPDIGYSFSQAYVVKTNDPSNEWVVIFGNGYNSDAGKAVLYILDLNGVIIRKIDTGVSGDNGLSTPALIDVDNDRKLDYVYAGDLKGNMWKFDLTADSAANWDIAFNDGTDPMPLFAAGQPITAKPDIMRHCGYDKQGYMVLFGTGKYLHNDDRLNTDQQTIYGIWDYGDDSDDDEYVGAALNHATGQIGSPGPDIPGTYLLKQTVVDIRDISGYGTYRTFSDNPAVWGVKTDTDTDEKPNPDTGTHVGWFIDFPNASPYEGERVFKGVQIRDGKVFVISFFPDSSPCSGGGNSWFYIIDACDGGRLPETNPQFEIGVDEGTVQVGTDAGGNPIYAKKNTIKIGEDAAGQPILAPPTGKLFKGTLHEPKIIRKPGTGLERLYMSSSTGVVETEDVPAERRGTLYWLER